MPLNCSAGRLPPAALCRHCAIVILIDGSGSAQLGLREYHGCTL